MSAANWRKAMNSGAGRLAMGAPRPVPQAFAADRQHASGGRDADTRAAWLRDLARRVSARHVVVLAFLIAYPFVATPFFTFQIGAQSLALGTIALSLAFLA